MSNRFAVLFVVGFFLRPYRFASPTETLENNNE